MIVQKWSRERERRIEKTGYEKFRFSRVAAHLWSNDCCTNHKRTRTTRFKDVNSEQVIDQDLFTFNSHGIYPRLRQLTTNNHSPRNKVVTAIPVMEIRRISIQRAFATINGCPAPVLAQYVARFEKLNTQRPRGSRQSVSDKY